MNAKMRIGHFTVTQPNRLRVNMAVLTTALTGILLVTSQAMTAGLPGYDTNLERWAKERLAQRIGDLRDSYQPSEPMRMVTEIDIERGPPPLGAKRSNDPFSLLVGMDINKEFNTKQDEAEYLQLQSPFPPRRFYDGALMLARN